MTDVKNCFPSADTLTTITATVATIATTIEAVTSEEVLVTPQKKEPHNHEYDNDSGGAVSPFVLNAPRVNSKLILQNMEEVLNSVKKKHRQKHKRKKEQKRLAQLAEAEAEAATNTEKGYLNDKKMTKQPLREKSAQENGLSHCKSKHKSKKSPLKCSTPVAVNASIMKHFPRTPKKESPTLDSNAANTDQVAATDDVDTKQPAKPSNVFEIMMNARNRSIGMNSTGQELMVATPTSDAVSPTNVKRKLLLQEWADRKGGIKRKIEEEAREAYVEHQLEQRAKRLKKMLTHPQDASTKPTEEATKKPKRGKGRPRTRRLSSLDSIGSIESITPAVPDADTCEFLSKLNSPTKKRDSLLGYFPKKTTPKEQSAEKPVRHQPKANLVMANSPATDSNAETPKRRKRGNVPKTTDEVVENSPMPSIQSVGDVLTPSGRPKRSCAGKARYDFDLDASPTKAASVKLESPKSDRHEPLETSLDVIELDDSNSAATSDGTPQTPKRLAPLFVRQMPKPSPDPSMLRAREEFLRSGVPDKLKQEQSRQKQFEQCYEDNYEHFPRVSHVQQLADVHLPSFDKTAMPLQFKVEDFKEISSCELGINPLKTCAIGSVTNCTSADYKQATCRIPAFVNFAPLPPIDYKRNIVKAWKTEFDRFPTYKCYNQMCEKYRYFRAVDSEQDTQQVSESFVVTRRSRRSMEAQKFREGDDADVKPPAAAPNGELLFTEKYKPLLFEQVLVNLTPVQQLRDFLSNWTNGTGNNSPSNIQRNSQNLDETFDSANDSNSSSAAVCNTMVLVGPSSSGKTNAVFALANDLNFNVLEINAGMRRTGKKLIQELHEATQSHQIRKDSKSTQSKQLLKMSLSGLKAKRKKAQISAEQQEEDLGQSVRKSLILIEDADIHFEQTDAGFTDAIYTLAASSKRPVIVVATDPNCMHLQRLMQQNKIEFKAPQVLNICRFLSVLALIENCPILLDDLVSLYSYNNQNLRKTLLELQFFIQSGGDRRVQETTLPRTPKKQEQETGKPTSPPFYASPSKEVLKQEDSDSATQEDEQLVRQRDVADKKSETLYMHHTLFEFYTCAQNDKCRIPFPVDFQLLRVNFSELLRASDKLHPIVGPNHGNSDASIGKSNAKRKSRSPKKAWLKSMAQSSEQSTASSSNSLLALCDFYEHISVATMLGTYDMERCADRLVPHLSEEISHSLVEQALDVQLLARPCAYNLFETPHKCPTIYTQLGNLQLRTRHVRALDYEPALRAICRSEQQRSNAERRSSRFYHYLRNYTVNASSFSADQYDAACEVFQEQDSSTLSPSLELAPTSELANT